MTEFGLPVPPGFILTTATCRTVLEHGWSSVLDDELAAGVSWIEQQLDRRLSDPGAALLVSVRSGAPVSMRSTDFATLSGLQQANVQLLGNPSEQLPQAELDDLKALAVDYWTRLTSLVTPWQAILDGDTKPPEARQQYVSSYALSLWALGFAGAAARDAHNGAAGHWTDALDGLGGIDWKKTNPDWQGICMAGNEVVTRVPTRRATANYIKWKLGLEAERPEPVIAD